MNFADYFESAADRFPDKTAIVFRDEKITYAQLRRRVDLLAGAFDDLGIRQGDVVGLLARNSARYLEMLLACAKRGVALEQYNWRMAPGLTAELLRESRSCVLFADRVCWESSQLDELNAGRELVKVVVEGSADGVSGIALDDVLAQTKPFEGDAPRSDDEALMHLFTSGTTGKPKTVRLSNKGVVSVALVCIAETGWTSDDVFLQVLPLFHISAQAAYNVLMLGGTLILHEAFSPGAYFDALRRYRVTRLGLVPNMLGALLDCEEFDSGHFPDVSTIIYAGSSMPRSVLEKTLDRLHCGLYAFYGMTEMSSVVGILKPRDHDAIRAKSKSAPVPIGKPSMGSRLRICAEDGTVLPAGQEGELVVRSDGMMLGYSRDDLTERAMRDGWYWTGDMCYCDEEGYYYLVGRKGDMIVSGGENIYPSEVEECIRRMGDAVSDVAVVGIPDDKWGQMVAAAVVTRKGFSLEEADIAAWCSEALASYKKPRRVAFVDDLPRNANGKVVRKEVARMLVDG